MPAPGNATAAVAGPAEQRGQGPHIPWASGRKAAAAAGRRPCVRCPWAAAALPWASRPAPGPALPCPALQCALQCAAMPMHHDWLNSICKQSFRARYQAAAMAVQKLFAQTLTNAIFKCIKPGRTPVSQLQTCQTCKAPAKPNAKQSKAAECCKAIKRNTAQQHQAADQRNSARIRRATRCKAAQLQSKIAACSEPARLFGLRLSAQGNSQPCIRLPSNSTRQMNDVFTSPEPPRPCWLTPMSLRPGARSAKRPAVGGQL